MDEIMMMAVLREHEYREARLRQTGHRPKLAGPAGAAARVRLAALLLAVAARLAPVSIPQAVEVPQLPRPVA